VTCQGPGKRTSGVPIAELSPAPKKILIRTEGLTYDRVVPHPAGCPRIAFCGCGASVRIFGHPVRDLYLAANWGRFPRANPAPGMAAYRNHHVFVIEQVNGDGTVVAYDANSGGHATRIHTISLHGYRVVDPNGNRMAART